MSEKNKASFEFVLKLKGKDKEPYAKDPTIVVLAEGLGEAYVEASELLGDAYKNYDLAVSRIVDHRLLVGKTEVLERHMLIEERHSDHKIEHSGEITEKRLNLTS